MKPRHRFRFCCLTMMAVIIVACSVSLPDPGEVPTEPTYYQPGPHASPTFTPFMPLIPTSGTPVVELPVPQPTVTLAPVPTSIQEAVLWLSPDLPLGLSSPVILPAGFLLADNPSQANLRIQVGDQRPISRWIYALAAPFPTLASGISFHQLKSAWIGDAVEPYAGRPLLMDDSTLAVFSALWGEPASHGIKLLSSEEILDYAWENRPSWAIVPFEALDPRWKVLEIDGMSPVRKDFNAEIYPLSVSFSIDGEGVSRPEFEEGLLTLVSSLPETNRDINRLTILAMTGVTALVRCTAATMERRGYTYPAEDIRHYLINADITHISNEVTFAPTCPFPDCYQTSLIFCSRPEYISLLEDIGTDVVELTGDHLHDWGNTAILHTLDMYRERGWQYYGGGENIEDGRQPTLLEHNGNRIAFIGCNAKGRNFAKATETTPGAVVCDFDYMHSEIARLRAEGYLPIATFQHYEYYQYHVPVNMKEDFRSMARAGAVIVSGSQAHQPHGMEFIEGAFIHYGLGNLFFDQIGNCQGDACAKAFIDIHVIYDGKHISTELIPIQFIDFARTRLMTTEEKNLLLNSVFNASDWR
jgi:hypothetical protein